jgi:hypothetical protein
MQQAGVKPKPPSIGLAGYVWTWVGSNGGVQMLPGATPQPGDMVLFGTATTPVTAAGHVGIVAQVLPNGQIVVIGGNEGSSNTTSTVGKSQPFDPNNSMQIMTQMGWSNILAYARPPGV